MLAIVSWKAQLLNSGFVEPTQLNRGNVLRLPGLSG